jgi:drug/metabolite transporter (DMT)-like permease
LDNKDVKIKNIIDFILLSALWGGSYVFMKFTAGFIEPIVVAESRMLIAAVCLGLFSLFNRHWWQYLRMTWPQYQKTFVISIFNSVIPFTLFTYAMQYLNAGIGAILNATSPIWTAIIAAFWLKDRLSPYRLFGLFLGFLGIVLLVWGKVSFSVGGLGLPFLASIGVTISYGFATNYMKKYCEGIHPIGMTLVSMIIGSFILAIPAYQHFPTGFVPNSAWIGMLGLGVGSTAVAYFLFYRLIEQTSPAIAISTTFLVPVFSILWGDIFLNEEPTLQMMVCGGIILLGTALAVGILPLKKLSRASV